MIFRFGALVGADTPQAIQEPGLLITFPEPIDKVLRFPAQKIYNLEIDALDQPKLKEGSFLAKKTLDPEKVGYVLTADRNVFHLRFAIRYSLRDPQQYFTAYGQPEDSLSLIAQASVVEVSAQKKIDDILTEGRLQWMREIKKKTQKRIDESALGIEIVSMEILDVQVPAAVRSDFKAVLSASVDAQTQEQEANTYRAEQIPKSETWAQNHIKRAEAESIERVAQAEGEVNELLKLLEGGESISLLKARLYRERLSRIFSDVGAIRFIAPPKKGMRIYIEEGP